LDVMNILQRFDLGRKFFSHK